MSALTSLKMALDKLLGLPPHIYGKHLAEIDQLLNLEHTLRILGETESDDDALSVIAARSYTHSLGFRKITLLEPSITLADGSKSWYQVRLHLWAPGKHKAVPLVESKHEHSFDFISRVLVGEMENQCYTARPLTDEEDAVLQRLRKRLELLDENDRALAHEGIEALQTIRLASLGSEQAVKQGLSVDRTRLQEVLSCTDDELDVLANMHGRYEYDATASTFGGNYVHRLTSTISLVPAAVLKLQAGDLYHHPNQFIHRLFIERQPNATIIVTTPRTHGVNGASFQHPTWFSGENANYGRRMYTVAELKEVLQDFRTLLSKQAAQPAGRLLDVSGS